MTGVANRLGGLSVFTHPYARGFNPPVNRVILNKMSNLNGAIGGKAVKVGQG